MILNWYFLYYRIILIIIIAALTGHFNSIPHFLVTNVTQCRSEEVQAHFFLCKEKQHPHPETEEGVDPRNLVIR